MLVVDAASTVGGVWAEHRIYPGLRTNNIRGRYEYPDYPLDDSFGVGAGEHIPGAVVHNYLTSYAKKFGVFSRARFNTKVESVAQGEKGGWELRLTNVLDGKPANIKTERLVVATGLTTEPNMPVLRGADVFDAPILHAVDFAQHSELTKTAKKVVVLGGAKSAWDVAYAFASTGAEVDMVVRQSGKGPVWMAPAYVTPFKRLLEGLVTTRFITWMSPCIWGDEDGYGRIRSFLHQTRFGRWIVDKFWWVLENDVVQLNGYDSHPDLKTIKPWYSAFYVGNGLSIFNYPTDPLDMVRQGKIRTHVGDVDSLSPGSVNLSSGETIKTDALLCATGWRHRPEIDWIGMTYEELGLPHRSSDPEPLSAEANAGILRQFPRLKRQPRVGHRDPEGIDRPFRLYRFMVPPSFAEERSIAFVGMMKCLATTSVAHIQALWISAFFDGKLDRLPTSEEEMRWQTMLHTQWVKLRYPTGHADQFPDFVFDAIPYLDMLLGDLGVRKRRKAGRIAELTDPYSPESYKDVLDEWREKKHQ